MNQLQGLEVIGRGLLGIKVYPDFDAVPDGWLRCNTEGEFTVYEMFLKELSAKVEYSLSSETTEKKVYDIEIKLPQETTEVFRIKYQMLRQVLRRFTFILPTTWILKWNKRLQILKLVIISIVFSFRVATQVTL